MKRRACSCSVSAGQLKEQQVRVHSEGAGSRRLKTRWYLPSSEHVYAVITSRCTATTDNTICAIAHLPASSTCLVLSLVIFWPWHLIVWPLKLIVIVCSLKFSSCPLTICFSSCFPFGSYDTFPVSAFSIMWLWPCDPGLWTLTLLSQNWSANFCCTVGEGVEQTDRQTVSRIRKSIRRCSDL